MLSQITNGVGEIGMGESQIDNATLGRLDEACGHVAEHRRQQKFGIGAYLFGMPASCQRGVC